MTGGVSVWWKRSASSAFRGGISGSIAMVLQVVLLMWLRTVVNYQYRHGVGVLMAFRTLYKEGGILRFYRGASFALLTGPISRFGDTAANEGIKDLMSGSNLPVWVITMIASLTAASWRVTITPLDTIKTTLQVSGTTGWDRLFLKVRTNGIQVLWDGAIGNWLGTLAGHYPWFIVNNWLEKRIPQPQQPNLPNDKYKHVDKQQYQYQRSKLIRRAFIGFCSSFASDCVSNGIRVVKTYKQTSDIPLSYSDALLGLVEESGLYFLFRGLGLKLISNGLSGILFSIIWKMIMERMNSNANAAQETSITPTENNNKKMKNYSNAIEESKLK